MSQSHGDVVGEAASRPRGVSAAVPGPTGRRVRVMGNLFHPTVPDGAVYVGRAGPSLPASRFENRHRIGGQCRACGQDHDQAGAVAAYAADLESFPQLLAAARAELGGGVDLACWCRPESGPCHGDVLRLAAAGVDPLAAHLACLAEHDGHREDADVLVGLSLALRTVPGPASPVDGDCLIWEPQVRQAARRAGYAADLGQVTGWLDARARVMVYLHQVTIVAVAGGVVVVDLTAQQFAQRLPNRWYAPETTYREHLSQATGCANVTISRVPG